VPSARFPVHVYATARLQSARLGSAARNSPIVGAAVLYRYRREGPEEGRHGP
jgi:hypothetical protein